MTPPEGSHEDAPSWPLKTTQKQSSSRRAHTASEWGAVPPKRQAQGGIHVRPEARIAANSAPAIGTPTRAGPSVRQHAQRHRTERNCGCEIAKYPTKGVLRDFARRDGDFHGT